MSADEMRVRRITLVTPVGDPEGKPVELFEVEVTKDVRIRLTRKAAERLLERLKKATHGGGKE